VRLHVITRDSAEEAWAEARRLLERIVSPGAIEEAQRHFAPTESVGQAVR
jgi:alkanesulfonate monooxygenase